MKTAPKPLTVAGVAPLVPGTKNKPSVMLLPTGVNRRNGLKVLKIVAVGRIVEQPGQTALGTAGSGAPATGPSPVW